MDENKFNSGSAPVAVAARVYGKDASWVRAVIVSGWLPIGSAEETTAIRNFAALHKLRIDEMKAQTEADEKRERRMMDSEQRRAELALKEREQSGKDADRIREEAFRGQQVRD